MNKTDERTPLLESKTEGGESEGSAPYSWLFFALVTAVCIGFTNFLIGDLSARLGVAGSFPIFYGIVAMSILYHLFVPDSTGVYF